MRDKAPSGLPPPNVIEISDDEESDENAAAPITNAVRLSWIDVADRLAMLAKNCALRDNQGVVDRLLVDSAILPSSKVRHSLQAMIEMLGDLLVLLEGHDRRYRASEGLVMVMCEVLSLFQTAPCRSRATQQWIKTEESMLAVDHYMEQLVQRIDQWGSILGKVACSSDFKAYAKAVTMSRLKRLCDDCMHDNQHLQKSMMAYKGLIQGAAEEFVKVLGECRDELKKRGFEAVELELKVFDETYNKTRDAQDKFYSNSMACQSVSHHVKEMELRHSFYQAAYALACAATPRTNGNKESKQQHIPSIEHINKLGSTMLEDMDAFCAALQAVMGKSLNWPGTSGTTSVNCIAKRTLRRRLLCVAKHFEVFWLVHRNWLPPLVLEIFVKKVDNLVDSNALANCPLTNAVSRVCASLRLGFANM